MPETPELGIPYPAAADAVTDWPAAAQELAEKVEEVVLGAAEGLLFASRTTDAGAGIILSLPPYDFDGSDYWVEVFAAGWTPGALSIGGGGGGGAHYITRSGVAIASTAAMPPANPTDGGNPVIPFYAKFLVTPAAGAAIVLAWTHGGASGPGVYATGLAKAWMRLTRAEV